MNTKANISVYRKIIDTEPRAQISISDFCWYQMADNSYLPEITAIRNEPDKEKRTLLKRQLPAVTLSGLFSGGHKAENLVKHSGFIALDFDSGDNPQVTDWPQLRTDLGKIREVLFSCLSVSGKGVFIIIPLSEQNQHKRHFQALQKDFDAMGLKIDKGCSDVCRLRYWSHDPSAIWNGSAKPYSKLFIKPKPQPRPQATAKDTDETPTIEILARWTDKSFGHFREGNRHTWVLQFAAACNRHNIPQSEIERYCATLPAPDFTQTEIEKIIKAIYQNKSFTGKAIL